MATNLPAVELTEPEREIFAKITANDVTGLKLALAQFQGSIDFVDENGMSPLQHACYKQNPEAVQSLLDRVRILRVPPQVFGASHRTKHTRN